MKRSRFTETQIVSILKGVDAGRKVKEICRRHGISDATYYNWKSRYGGMSASELKRLKELEGELSQYKKMYAELARENYALKELIEKKFEAVGEARSGALPGGPASIEYDPSVCRGEALALELVPAGGVGRGEGPRSDRSGEHHRGEAPALGILDVLRPPSPGGPRVESQAGVSRIQGHEAQFVPASQAPPADTGSTADGGEGLGQCGMVHGLHVRYALSRSPLPHAEHPR